MAGGGGGGGCRDSLFLEGACTAERGECGPWAAFLFWQPGRGTVETGEWGRRASVCIWRGGKKNGSPLGDDDNERWLRGGGRVGAVRGGLV